MSDTNDLMSRLDAEFRGVEQQIKQQQVATQQDYAGRQQRLDQFAALCDKLGHVWRPRLEGLAERFREKVKISPSLSKSRRAATINFQSPLARFDLTFSAMTDDDVRHLVLDSTLEILPILMKFEKNRQLELPLDAVDPNVVGKWIDDQIVYAVQTYLKLHQNANYLKGHLVSDPVANIEFPKYAAAATLDWNGKTYYFIGDETRDEFAKKNKISV